MDNIEIIVTKTGVNSDSFNYKGTCLGLIDDAEFARLIYDKSDLAKKALNLPPKNLESIVKANAKGLRLLVKLDRQDNDGKEKLLVTESIEFISSWSTKKNEIALGINCTSSDNYIIVDKYNE